MKHPASLSLISLGLAASATAIDLTPQIVTLVVGDYAVRRACFADGDKKYAVTVDSETELTGSGGTALFNFSKFPRAVMRLAPSPLKPQIVFAGATLERYRATAASLWLFYLQIRKNSLEQKMQTIERLISISGIYHQFSFQHHHIYFSVFMTP